MNRALFVLPLILVGVPAPLMAQPASPGAAIPAMQNGSLIIDQGRSDRQPAVAPATLLPPPPATRGDVRAIPKSISSEQKLLRVRVEGSNAPLTILQRTFEAFIGRTLDTATITAVANALSDAYGKGDVALYTIVVPEQDLSRGVLSLRVVEGYIADVVITGDVRGRDLTLIRKYAAKLVDRRPLKRPALERYLSLIRDISGLAVDVQLLNLAAPGAVRLVLSLKHDDLQFGLAVNNRGVANLGRTQMQASVTVNSGLRQGDQTRLTVSLPTDVGRFQYYGLAHSTPIGANGLRLGANVGYLRTRPARIPAKGEATSAGVTLSYPLRRSYKDNVLVSLGIDGLDSDNALFGQLVASDHTRALRGSVSWSKVEARRAMSLALTTSKGLDILRARSDPMRTELGFLKLNVQAGFNQVVGKEFALRLSATAQASKDRLPASEQFSLGGDFIGRAFPSGYVIGDRGIGGLAELGWASASLWPGFLKGSEIYGFADGGKLWTESRYRGLLPRQQYSLASAGGGMRLNIRKKMIVDLEAARPLDLPYANTTKNWRFTIGWRSLH